MASMGTYIDSYSEHAKFLLAGPRCVIGASDGFHTSVGVFIGFLHGSGSNGFGAMPVVSIGYDWFDVCITGSPKEKGHQDSSTMIAAFLKFRLFTF